MFESFAVLILVVIVLGVLSSFIGKTPKPSSTTPKTKPMSDELAQNYAARPSLFVNAPESQLFQTLVQMVPPGAHVMAKTRLEDIIGVKPHIKGNDARPLRSRIKSRHVDFLVINTLGQPLFAVELDGKSHSKATKNADELKDRLFAAAPLHLYRIKVGENYQQRISQILHGLNLA